MLIIRRHSSATIPSQLLSPTSTGRLMQLWRLNSSEMSQLLWVGNISITIIISKFLWPGQNNKSRYRDRQKFVNFHSSMKSLHCRIPFYLIFSIFFIFISYQFHFHIFSSLHICDHTYDLGKLAGVRFCHDVSISFFDVTISFYHLFYVKYFLLFDVK